MELTTVQVRVSTFVNDTPHCCEKRNELNLTLKKPKVLTYLRFAESYFADILVTGLMKTESHRQ